MTKYCSDPRHSRLPTYEEYLEDYNKRKEAIKYTVDNNLVSAQEVARATQILDVFIGYRRCTL